MEIDPYTTHLPVLYLLSQLMEFDEIHEFGMGYHSTPLLCNQEVYNVKGINSITLYEDNIHWFNELRQCNDFILSGIKLIGDDRINTRICNVNQMCAFTETIFEKHMYNEKMLMFIDNSDEPGRRQLIKNIAEGGYFTEFGSVVVFHDAENYMDLLQPEEMTELILFDAFKPHTMIAFAIGACNANKEKRDRILSRVHHFNAFIKDQNGLSVPPLKDSKAWIKYIKDHMIPI